MSPDADGGLVVALYWIRIGIRTGSDVRAVWWGMGSPHHRPVELAFSVQDRVCPSCGARHGRDVSATAFGHSKVTKKIFR